MNQKLMIENLKELCAELWKHAAASESITPAAWAESLDKAIDTLERIRWRKVPEEMPKCWEDALLLNGSAVLVGWLGKDDDACYWSSDVWSPDNVTHWAYPPELPKEEE